ncbi:ATP-dependent RNA helicase ROK1 [Ophiocordyceps camponoti-floridani]|uniref:ATP-dependent RNA helicase n=1 Tax=Ophiocordyceps camponoti-floridani TaxID=2030778 RepID=A0A8H4VFE5_9HYPO|nr:ATP-dependent RNA helicase ROK1 [Ophiocordyceps camponoti-floridani]
MDILKLLSRGTKKPLNGARADGTATVKLPSAGIKTNPQLFHDNVRGQKRKRDGVEPQQEPVAENLPMVDFFAEPSNGKSPSAPPTVQRAPSPVEQPADKLSADECRELLRSHRLKLTLMMESERRPSSKNKQKGSKRVEKAVSEKAAKADKQLYPQPLRSFIELRNTYGISRRVSENLVAQGYRVPTEVQLGALPLLLRPELAMSDERKMADGVNFLAVAPTGSGKTISFLVPIINSVMRRRALGSLKGIHELEAIIVAPTRELVFQIVNEGRKLTQGTGLRFAGMRKRTRIESEQLDEREHDSDAGEDDSVQESEAEDGKEISAKLRSVSRVDFLVTTPLLLFRSLTSETDDQHKALPTVRELVLDEADVLLDPLFREQTIGIWTACQNPAMRVSCWSATMGSNIESLVVDQLRRRAERLGIAHKPLVRLVVGLKDAAVPNISHRLIYTASETGKLMALRQLLHPTAGDDGGQPLRPPFLVFTQTIDRASALREELKYDIPLEAGGSSRIAALHSDLSDSERAAVMRKFRAGDIWILITTDVLARGVDFAGVNGVVNYDVPGSSAAYVHRAGRTGRAGREGGVAVTFYTRDDIPVVKTVANAIAASEKQAGKTGADAGVQKWLLDALPDVAKADRKKLKERGVDSRRSGAGARITSKSGYDRRRENNRKGAIAGSKRRMGEAVDQQEEGEEEWTGFGD